MPSINHATFLGFPKDAAVFALKKFGSEDNGPAYYDVQRAVDYLLSNGDQVEIEMHHFF